jgi:hypothetical protein
MHSANWWIATAAIGAGEASGGTEAGTNRSTLPFPLAVAQERRGGVEERGKRKCYSTSTILLYGYILQAVVIDRLSLLAFICRWAHARARPTSNGGGSEGPPDAHLAQCPRESRGPNQTQHGHKVRVSLGPVGFLWVLFIIPYLLYLY